jgi:galactokinase
VTSQELYEIASAAFTERYAGPHTTAAYAPGRVEILGNHTDYNDGFVLSAAINFGTWFLATPSEDTTCRLTALDVQEETTFDLSSPAPSKTHPWANFVKGVFAKLGEHGRIDSGFLGLFYGNVPLGAGLSSSAALEMAAGKALGSLYGIRTDDLTLARIGQAAEHEFVGAKCGLLDQMSSLGGRKNQLILTDFRTLTLDYVPTGDDAAFLMCDTHVKHSLVDSKYNERRARCEEAASRFASCLPHPVSALRDVDWSEWERHSPDMDPDTARRAAHVIGENTRVLKGKELLDRGDLEAFGALMFESHESSRTNFENSCPELDLLVDTARQIPGALGARLSGGGFGGSVVVLIHPRDAEVVAAALRTAYGKEFGQPCDTCVIIPSDGARVL